MSNSTEANPLALAIPSEKAWREAVGEQIRQGAPLAAGVLREVLQDPQLRTAYVEALNCGMQVAVLPESAPPETAETVAARDATAELVAKLQAQLDALRKLFGIPASAPAGPSGSTDQAGP